MTPLIPTRNAALLVVDAAGVVIETNAAADALLGRSDLIGGSIDTIVSGPPSQDGATPRRLDATFARTAGGSLIPVLAMATPLGDRSIVGLVDLRDPAIIRDAFSPASSIPSRLVDALDVGLVVQVEGEIVSANAAAARTLGLTLDELLGRTSIDPRWRSVKEDGSAYPGEEHPAMVALRTGRQALSIMGVHTPDGELRWIDVDAKPLITHDGRTVATFTHFIDVTDRRRADAERDAALVRSEALLVDASDAVLLVDPDGTITYAGPSSRPALARSGPGIEGTNLVEFAGPEERAELVRVLEHCAARPAARVSTTIALAAPDGGRRWFEVRMRNATEIPEIGALIVTLADVHERVVAVERLRAVNEELEARIAERDEEHRIDHELARATELLGHCDHDTETEGVVWSAATTVFRDLPVTLLRARGRSSSLDLVGTTAVHATDVDADDCWAMRTHHVHESRPPDGLACRHLAHDEPPTLCVPLGVSSRPYGLLIVGGDGGHAAHARAFADRVGPFLGRSVDALT